MIFSTILTKGLTKVLTQHQLFININSCNMPPVKKMRVPLKQVQNLDDSRCGDEIMEDIVSKRRSNLTVGEKKVVLSVKKYFTIIDNIYYIY
jgi:hypothetical protein